jgi:hypothetical protein
VGRPQVRRAAIRRVAELVTFTKDMLDPAKHIVDTKKAHFEPGRFEDHYEEALKELLQSGQIEAPRQREPSKVVNLMDCGALLRQNVRVDYGGRPQRGRAIIVLRRRLAVRARGRRKLVSGPPRWHFEMRCINGHFVVTGPDIEPAEFKSRREARDWCLTHYPGSPIAEIGRDAARRGRGASNVMIMSPDDPLAKAHKRSARPLKGK